jgi:hypothetical protein
MSRIEKPNAQLKEMPSEEHADFDAAEWDRQFEADVHAGRIDAFADNALRDYAAGLTTKI